MQCACGCATCARTLRVGPVTKSNLVLHALEAIYFIYTACVPAHDHRSGPTKRHLDIWIFFRTEVSLLSLIAVPTAFRFVQQRAVAPEIPHSHSEFAAR